MKIRLTKGYVAVIDDADAHLVVGHRWFARKDARGYVYAARNTTKQDGSRTCILMHRVILGLTNPKIEGDHIDGDGLNNRRANLRAASREQNAHNCRIPRNNTSGFKGVSFDGRKQRWDADINVGGKHIDLGSFSTPEAAASAYDAASRKYHGEFGRPNV